jgi:hypothetical protein
MKLHVITDAEGRIVATARTQHKRAKSTAEFLPIPLPGQQSREVDLPAEFDKVTDPVRLHDAVTQLLAGKQ